MTGRKDLLTGALFVFALTLATAFTNRGFPPVNTDEAILANHAFNLTHGHTNRYSLYDDLFDQEMYVWRNAAAGVLQIVYEAWIGPFVTFPAKSLEAARISSLVAAFLTLFLWFLIGRAAGGTIAGYTTVAIGWAFPFFQLAASLVRAEIVMLMAASLIIYVSIILPNDKRWKTALLGALCGLSIGIHQNAVPFFLGFLTFNAFAPSMEKSWRKLALLCGWALIGAGVIFCLINVVDFWRSQQLIVYDLYRPPVLSWPWNPFEWSARWLRLILTGLPTWYLPNNESFAWIGSVALFWAAMILAVISGRGNARAMLLYPAGAAGVLAGFLLLIKKNEAIYTVMLLPFLAPFLGAAFATGLKKKSPFAYAGVAALFVSLFLFANFRAQYRAATPDYNHLVNQIKSVTPTNARVAAPNIFWFAWPEENFRDISALVGSRWVTGRRDVGMWLSGWKPDVIVIEPSWKRMLLGTGDTEELLKAHLGPGVKHLGDLDTGPTLVGKLEIFELRWDKNP